MDKIIILDFGTSEVHIFQMDTIQFKESEDFLKLLEETNQISKVKDCEWMIVDQLNIHIH